MLIENENSIKNLTIQTISTDTTTTTPTNIDSGSSQSTLFQTQSETPNPNPLSSEGDDQNNNDDSTNKTAHIEEIKFLLESGHEEKVLYYENFEQNELTKNKCDNEVITIRQINSFKYFFQVCLK